MAKIIVLFGKPKDPEAFDKEYWEQHVPIAKQMPGLRRFTVNKVVPPPGREPAYYQVVEMEFDSMDALKRAVATEKSKEATKHALKLATGGMTFLYTESREA